MKVFYVPWNDLGTVFHEIPWKKNFKVYPSLNKFYKILFLIKLQASSLQFYLKRDLGTGFSCQLFEISKNTFFTEHIWTTASNTVKPLISGQLQALKNLSVIERCPLLGSNFKKVVTFGIKYFVRYSWHFRYLGCPLLGGFTVTPSNNHLICYSQMTFLATLHKIWSQLTSI